MGTNNSNFLKNTIANWLAGHQDELGPLRLNLSGPGSSHLLGANSRHIHMSVPSYVGSLHAPISSKDVFVVTAADPRLNAAFMALNKKLKCLCPDADSLIVAMEYLVAALKKYQAQDFQPSSSSAQQGEQCNHGVSVHDGENSNDDGDNDMDREDGDDYCVATKVDFVASFEFTSRLSTAVIEMRSKGYLFAMAADAKQQCNRARHTFSSPCETVDCARENMESILAWCSVKPEPGYLLVLIKMQIGGILSSDVAAASLGLPVDFPMCISLQFNEDHWCRKENNCPLHVDACIVRATNMKANTTNEEGTQFVNHYDHRHRFGEAVLLPELIDCYFRFLKTHDRMFAKSVDILKDLTNHASKNVFVGLICFLSARLRALPNWCVVCWNTLPYNVGRLRTCDRDFCLYRFEEIGFGTNLLQEVQKYPELIDFEVSLAITALESARDVFEPFPTFLLEGSELRGRSGWFSKKLGTGTKASYNNHSDTSTSNHGEDLGNKKLSVLKSILYAYPSVDVMQSCSDEGELRKILTESWQNRPRQEVGDHWKEKLWLPYDVLRFLLLTSRLTIYSLRGSEALSQFKNAIYQFAVLHDNPEKEAHFEKRRKEKGGSFFAFHGSATGNWYSILRNGLRSLSKTSYMSSGAVHGSGIYTTSDMSISLSYSKEGSGWEHGKLHCGFSVVAICEIVEGSTNYCSNIMVVPPQYEQDISIRYILVYSGTFSRYADSLHTSITSTILESPNSNSTDLLNHHRGVRQLYHLKKQSEWGESRKVRWMSMKAMCKNEEEEEQRIQASSHVEMDVKS